MELSGEGKGASVVSCGNHDWPGISVRRKEGGGGGERIERKKRERGVKVKG